MCSFFIAQITLLNIAELLETKEEPGLNKKLGNHNSIRNSLKRTSVTSLPNRDLFGISQSNYFVLATALAVLIFFLTLLTLNTENAEFPIIIAGIIAILVFLSAVTFRTIVMQKNQRRLNNRIKYNQINQNLRELRNRRIDTDDVNKLTLEKNALILEEIEKKSQAAQVLGKLPEAHLEVFELCEEYLEKNEAELEKVRVGSPRLPMLRKSREKIKKLHKYHLLTWASLESRLLFQKAKNQSSHINRIEHSQKALSVLNSAAQFYPNEKLLNDSICAVEEFISKVKVENWTELAEQAAFKNNYKNALDHYQDALFYLTWENNRTPENDLIAEKINLEIEKLSVFLNQH